MAEKAEVRDKQYQDILCNEDGDDSTPSYYSLYGLASVAAGTAANLSIALIPFHDSIKEPFYFYENLLSMLLIQTPLYAIVYVWEFAYIMNMDLLRNLKICARVSFGLIICKIFLRGLTNFLWIYIAGNSYPMPFHYMLETFALFPPTFILLWLQCPK